MNSPAGAAVPQEVEAGGATPEKMCSPESEGDEEIAVMTVPVMTRKVLGNRVG